MDYIEKQGNPTPNGMETQTPNVISNVRKSKSNGCIYSTRIFECAIRYGSSVKLATHHTRCKNPCGRVLLGNTTICWWEQHGRGKCGRRYNNFITHTPLILKHLYSNCWILLYCNTNWMTWLQCLMNSPTTEHLWKRGKKSQVIKCVYIYSQNILLHYTLSSNNSQCPLNSYVKRSFF